MFRNHCDPNLRTKLRRRCVAQGILSPFCMIALAAFATRNVPMPVFMQFHRVFVKLSQHVCNCFAWNLNRRAFRRGFHLHFASLPWCNSPPTVLRRRRSIVSRGLLQCFDDMFTKTLHEIRTDLRFAGGFTSIWRPCPGTFAVPHCALMMYRRGFLIFLVPNRVISLFAAYSRFFICFETVATPICAQNCGGDTFRREIHLQSETTQIPTGTLTETSSAFGAL